MTAPITFTKLASGAAIIAVVGVVAAFLGYLGLLLYSFRRYGRLLPED